MIRTGKTQNMCAYSLPVTDQKHATEQVIDCYVDVSNDCTYKRPISANTSYKSVW